MLTARNWRERGQRYRLEAGKCTKCGRLCFPPRLICPECDNREFEIVSLCGKGKIVSYTVIRVPTSDFSDQAPYALGVIELDCGARLTAQIADCDFGDLAAGKAVELEFRKVSREGEAGIHCYGYKAILA